jgi:AraC-like DNA-binding protein
MSPADLDTLLSALEVRVVALTECLVSMGFALQMGSNAAPGIHYNLKGTGKLYFPDQTSVDISPHTLIIVPANCAVRIEAPSDGRATSVLKATDGRVQKTTEGILRRFVAGEGEPEILLICGFFLASYGTAVDLFATLSAPIVEQFDTADQLDQKLEAALAELVAEEVGSGTMSSALLKQVIVALLRRSLRSLNLWVERFSMLSDPQIARAFAAMAARPGAPHTVQSLAESACLSRSTFMARFTQLVGRSPMAILRDLRMRDAAQQLKATNLSIDQIAHNMGYSSRSSFTRAFKKTYGSDPAGHQAGSKIE